MIRRMMFGLVAAAALCASAPAFAHHSVSAQFDVDQVKMSKVILSKVEWINPHTYFTFIMTEADGSSHPIAMESMAPAALRRAGIAGRDSLKPGDTYTVYYHPARNGKNTTGLLSAFTLPDGRTIGATSAKSLEQIKKLQRPKS